MSETTGIWSTLHLPKARLLNMVHFSSKTLNVALMPESTLIYAKIIVLSEQKSKKCNNNYKLLSHNSRFSEDENNYQKSIFILFTH